MNNQTVIPRIPYIVSGPARAIRGDITFFLDKQCNLSMTSKDRSGKFMRVKKSALLYFCDIARYQPMTIAEVKDHFKKFFGIVLIDVSKIDDYQD